MKNIQCYLQGFAFVLLLCIFHPLSMAGGFDDVNTIDDLLVNPDQSQKCMQCHDGSAAKEIVLKDADAPLQISGHKNVNHPVGLDYRRYANESPMTYVRIENLDARIQLENGNVTCITCHEIKQEMLGQATDLAELPEQACASTGELTIGLGRGGLCVSCHAM
ncbi:MAG: hypothetical protein OQK69_06015 [Gammaproteobacteria bacterium]|nr:hypothetical protein [Gammaproteobacteria bacterium]